MRHTRSRSEYLFRELNMICCQALVCGRQSASWLSQLCVSLPQMLDVDKGTRLKRGKPSVGLIPFLFLYTFRSKSRHERYLARKSGPIIYCQQAKAHPTLTSALKSSVHPNSDLLGDSSRDQKMALKENTDSTTKDSPITLKALRRALDLELQKMLWILEGQQVQAERPTDVESLIADISIAMVYILAPKGNAIRALKRNHQSKLHEAILKALSALLEDVLKEDSTERTQSNARQLIRRMDSQNVYHSFFRWHR